MTILGRAFLDVLEAQTDLLVLFVSEHQLLADDARLVGFIDLAASGFAAELAGRARNGEIRADLDGYLFARSFMGSLASFVVLQRVLGMDRIHAVDADAFLTELRERVQDVAAVAAVGVAAVAAHGVHLAAWQWAAKPPQPGGSASCSRTPSSCPAPALANSSASSAAFTRLPLISLP